MVRLGKDVGGSADLRVGQLITGILTGQNHGSGGHGMNGCEGVRHAVLQLSHELFINGTSHGLCFSGPRLVPLGQGGVSPLLFHIFLVKKNHIEKLWNLIPPPPPLPQNFSTLPEAILQSSGPKMSPLSLYPRVSTKLTAMGAAGRLRRREALEVALRAGGGVGQRGGAQRGFGGNKGGGGANPQYQLNPRIWWRVVRVISGMWWRGGTSGWEGTSPKSSHHWEVVVCH